jgi:tetratricopeptide (TPR) repeat protein
MVPDFIELLPGGWLEMNNEQPFTQLTEIVNCMTEYTTEHLSALLLLLNVLKPYNACINIPRDKLNDSRYCKRNYLKLFKNADTMLNYMIKKIPQSDVASLATAWYDKARVAAMKGDRDKAVRSLAMAIKLDPQKRDQASNNNILKGLLIDRF